MKKLFYLVIIIAGLFSCENQERSFPDFEYQAVYFPIQFPIRTLVLGEDRINNDLDNAGEFNIGVSIGGMYENTSTWTVTYRKAPELVDSLKTSAGDSIYLMPDNYYTIDPEGLNPENTITIPSGSFNGLLRIRLAEAFFNDPLSIGNHYVIPLEIDTTDADTILRGILSAGIDPDVADKRNLTQWDAANPPKDYTLFMVKYINAYHGTYLRSGLVEKLDPANGSVLNTTTYSARYVEDGEIVRLATSGRYEVEADFLGQIGGGIKLIVDPNANTISVDSVAGLGLAVSGSGNVYPSTSENALSWGGKDWQTITIDYEYIQDDTTYRVVDTLVMRNRGVAFEQFTLTF